MWLRAPAWVLALAGVLLLLGSGLGVRAGLWTFQTGFVLLRWSAYVGLAAAALCLVALAVPRLRRRAVRSLLAVLVASLAVAYVPWQQQQRARSVPPIHDITTDTDNPPAFVAVLPLRAKAPNSAAYGGREIAEQQRKAYPDIQPLNLGVPPSVAFSRALDIAEAMGWKIVASDPASGRIEAVATTLWFGFSDDVVVRIASAGDGSRIDVRSVSRVGRSDVGTNAHRIREYLAKLRT
jgi:uncharacterized protein (DUF1499 family)